MEFFCNTKNRAPILCWSNLLYESVCSECSANYVSTVSAPPPLFCWRGGAQPLVPNFQKGGSEKNECLGGFQESLPKIFTCCAGRVTMFLVKKDFAGCGCGFKFLSYYLVVWLKWDVVLRDQFSNVNLGLF